MCKVVAEKIKMSPVGKILNKDSGAGNRNQQRLVSAPCFFSPKPAEPEPNRAAALMRIIKFSAIKNTKTIAK